MFDPFEREITVLKLDCEGANGQFFYFRNSKNKINGSGNNTNCAVYNIRHPCKRGHLISLRWFCIGMFYSCTFGQTFINKKYK